MQMKLNICEILIILFTSYDFPFPTEIPKKQLLVMLIPVVVNKNSKETPHIAEWAANYTLSFNSPIIIVWISNAIHSKHNDDPKIIYLYT